uniref:Fibronectin type-III domain-containing protein n=1 Tax=Anser cygnoides TaxID=8845 RepID=A0A8B9D4V3_ANSCY
MAVPAAFLAPILLLCGLGLRLAAAHGPTGVECVLFNEEYMTCVWGSRETLTTNYSLYYWYENRSPVVECKRYLWDRGVSIGCHFNQSEIVQFQPFHVLLNASLNGQALEIRSKRMELQDLVKPGAPVNLTIRNMSSNQLQLTWSSPYPKAQCLEHAVKYKSNKDTSWIVRGAGGGRRASARPHSAGPHCLSLVSPQEHGVKGDIFSFPSVDYEKYYTFYVRSKINSYCGSTQLWSEWSVPVVWGRNTTSKGRSAPVALAPSSAPRWPCAGWFPTTRAPCRSRGGAAAVVLDPHGSRPHRLLPAPAGPRRPAGAHGKVSGRPGGRGGGRGAAPAPPTLLSHAGFGSSSCPGSPTPARTSTSSSSPTTATSR